MIYIRIMKRDEKKKEGRTEIAMVRLTKEEKEAFEKESDVHGLTLASWIRSICKDMINNKQGGSK